MRRVHKSLSKTGPHFSLSILFSKAPFSKLKSPYPPVSKSPVSHLRSYGPVFSVPLPMTILISNTLYGAKYSLSALWYTRLTTLRLRSEHLNCSTHSKALSPNSTHLSPFGTNTRVILSTWTFACIPTRVT